MRDQKLFQNFVKIGVITAIFLGIFQFGSIIISQTGEKKIAEEAQNIQNLQSAYSSNFGLVGVALSTRVGIGGVSGVQSKGGFYTASLQVGITTESRQKLRDTLISHNIMQVQEYLNLSKTDVKSLLDSSPDRKKTLESFISQLEIRYKNAVVSIENLNAQRNITLEALQVSQQNIENTKSSMEKNFSLNQADMTLLDISEYLRQKNSYNELYVDVVFIDQFIKQYNFLNAYNKKILDTLINNKEAIINKSYVVIPDSGEEYLREYDLIFDEAEIKAMKTFQ